MHRAQSGVVESPFEEGRSGGGESSREFADGCRSTLFDETLHRPESSLREGCSATLSLLNCGRG